MTTFDRSTKALENALGTLFGTADRPLARRNARARVLAALRGVRATLDRNYPPIKVVKTRTKLKTARGRLERMRREGWVDAYEHDIPKFAAAGVRVRSVKINHAGSGSDSQVIRTYYLIPEWARAIGPNKPSELKAAKRSRKLQAAVVATDLLRKSA